MAREQQDQLFEALVRAADAELLAFARAMARRLVGPDDAEDAISIVWEKLLTRQRDADGPEHGAFDPDKGTFTAFFRTVLHHACVDIQRRRKVSPQPYADAMTPGAAAHGELHTDPGAIEDDVLRRIAGIEDRIAGAIEVLDLSDTHRDGLRMLLGTQDAVQPAGPKAAAAARQRKKRLRDEVARLAGLTDGELEAAALVRAHGTVAAAATAAPGVGVPGLYGSARRKVLALFNIETEG